MAIKITSDINNYISISKKEESFIGLFAVSGYGKTLALQGLMEQQKMLGKTVIILNDVKDNFELGFAMFEPKERYHLNWLNHVGKPIQTTNVKIYHPFTFNIPNIKLPEINFYSLSLKDLGRSEWSLLSESQYESETIRLLLNASSNLENNEGLYSFLHKIGSSIQGKSNKEVKRDPKLFNLKIKGGTAKGLQEVVSYLLPFNKDYILQPNNSNLNLDWKKILNDNTSYHLFTTKYIKDDKIKQFCILSLLESIVRNLDYARKPICIIINEIRFLCPDRAKGYQEFLAYAIRKRLSTLRSMGRGVSGIFDSQVWSDVSQEVRQSFTVNFYGELGSASDIERLSKALKYKREISDRLKSMDVRNSYFMQGKEEEEPYVLWFPGHRHAESKYDFIETYSKEHPEKMKSYSELKKNIRKDYKDEIKMVDEQVAKLDEQEKQEELKEKEKKNKSKEKEDNTKIEKEKVTRLTQEMKKEKMKLVWTIYKQNPGISFRALGKEAEVDSKTAKKYIEQLIKIKEERERENVDTDYEDKALNQLS